MKDLVAGGLLLYSLDSVVGYNSQPTISSGSIHHSFNPGVCALCRLPFLCSGGCSTQHIHQLASTEQSDILAAASDAILHCKRVLVAFISAKCVRHDYLR